MLSHCQMIWHRQEQMLTCYGAPGELFAWSRTSSAKGSDMGKNLLFTSKFSNKLSYHSRFNK